MLQAIKDVLVNGFKIGVFIFYIWLLSTLVYYLFLKFDACDIWYLRLPYALSFLAVFGVIIASFDVAVRMSIK